MDKRTFNSIMKKYGFKMAGKIVLEASDLKFELTTDTYDHGHVYLWDECSNYKKHSIVYVGMAGKTIRTRCKQHTAGFKRSSTGKSLSTRLRDGLQANKTYALYVRKSETCNCHDETSIPMQCIDELAFIKKFSPPWNGSRKRA